MEQRFPVYLLPLTPMVRHSVATNAAKAKSGMSCECVRGSWMRRAQLVVQSHEFLEGD
jgi:hypothetical protein